MSKDIYTEFKDRVQQEIEVLAEFGRKSVLPDAQKVWQKEMAQRLVALGQNIKYKTNYIKKLCHWSGMKIGTADTRR